MTVKTPPLLCELHAHSTWSDGQLALAELVDLHGAHGFDVLVVTDHVLRRGDPWRLENPEGSWVDAANYDAYLGAIQAEAERARSRYGLLVVPGLELTFNDPDPEVAGHALAVGLRKFVPMDGGLLEAMTVARRRGAAIVAAHPHSDLHDDADRATRWFWREWRMLDGVIDRFELFNRREVFSWVANAGLPGVASGDFHRPEHLSSWKTLIPCAKTEAAVVGYLRSTRPAYVVRLERVPRSVREAA